MARFALFLLCVLLVSVNAQFTTSTWTESAYGGMITFCVSGSSITGSFSNRGIFQGSLSTNGMTASGNFYEAGIEDISCSSGQWTATISSSGSSFSGEIDCDDGNNFDWNETLISNNPSVTAVECAVLATSASSSTVEGTYRSNYYSNFNIAICVDDDEYQASYTEDNTEGYEYGTALLDGLIVSGSFNENTENFGVSIFFRLSNGELGNFYYVHDDDNDFVGFAETFGRLGEASNSECSRFDELEEDYDDLYDEHHDNDNNNNDDDDSSSSNNNDDDDESSAWALSVSVVALLVALVAF